MLRSALLLSRTSFALPNFVFIVARLNLICLILDIGFGNVQLVHGVHVKNQPIRSLSKSPSASSLSSQTAGSSSLSHTPGAGPGVSSISNDEGHDNPPRTPPRNATVPPQASSTSGGPLRVTPKELSQEIFHSGPLTPKASPPVPRDNVDNVSVQVGVVDSLAGEVDDEEMKSDDEETKTGNEDDTQTAGEGDSQNTARTETYLHSRTERGMSDRGDNKTAVQGAEQAAAALVEDEHAAAALVAMATAANATATSARTATASTRTATTSTRTDNSAARQTAARPSGTKSNGATPRSDQPRSDQPPFSGPHARSDLRAWVLSQARRSQTSTTTQSEPAQWESTAAVPHFRVPYARPPSNCRPPYPGRADITRPADISRPANFTNRHSNHRTHELPPHPLELKRQKLAKEVKETLNSAAGSEVIEVRQNLGGSLECNGDSIHTRCEVLKNKLQKWERQCPRDLRSTIDRLFYPEYHFGAKTGLGTKTGFETMSSESHSCMTFQNRSQNQNMPTMGTQLGTQSRRIHKHVFKKFYETDEAGLNTVKSELKHLNEWIRNLEETGKKRIREETERKTIREKEKRKKRCHRL